MIQYTSAPPAGETPKVPAVTSIVQTREWRIGKETIIRLTLRQILRQRTIKKIRTDCLHRTRRILPPRTMPIPILHQHSTARKSGASIPRPCKRSDRIKSIADEEDRVFRRDVVPTARVDFFGFKGPLDACYGV